MSTVQLIKTPKVKGKDNTVPSYTEKGLARAIYITNSNDPSTNKICIAKAIDEKSFEIEYVGTSTIPEEQVGLRVRKIVPVESLYFHKY
jgi:hypothetical protein